MGDMWDSVQWRNLIDKAGAKAGYVDDANYTWPAEAWQTFQGQPLLRISVRGDPTWEAQDCESGAATAEQVATAAVQRFDSREWTVVYCSQANLPNVQAALRTKNMGWTDAQYWPLPGAYLWAADPSGNIAAGRWNPPVTPIAVQDQWGAGWDHSTTVGSFPAATAPHPAPAPEPPPPPPPPKGLPVFVAYATDPPLQGDYYLISDGAAGPVKTGLTEAADQQELSQLLGVKGLTSALLDRLPGK